VVRLEQGTFDIFGITGITWAAVMRWRSKRVYASKSGTNVEQVAYNLMA